MLFPYSSRLPTWAGLNAAMPDCLQVRDMSLNEEDGKLVACSCNNSFVGVWVVDLNRMRPFSGPAVRQQPAGSGKFCNMCLTCSRLVPT